LNTPYSPVIQKVTFNSEELAEYIYAWADKSEDSMYCSSFVWHTFMLENLDLDSERIGLRNSGGMSEIAEILGKCLFTALFHFIGVMPDEIYYSEHLQSDMLDVAFGLENIGEPLIPIKISSCSIPDEILLPFILEAGSITGQEAHVASTITTYGAVIVKNTGKLKLQAKNGVDLETGFSVEPGGELDINCY
jgi:hypothetical protein